MKKSINILQDKKNKIKDFTNYGHILLVLSVFMYLNVLIPADPYTKLQLFVLVSGTVIFLIGSLTFYKKALRLKKE